MERSIDIYTARLSDQNLGQSTLYIWSVIHSFIAANWT